MLLTDGKYEGPQVIGRRSTNQITAFMNLTNYIKLQHNTITQDFKI